MAKYIIWSDHIAGVTTYEELVKLEQHTSVSSVVSTDDIEQLINAILNETDHLLYFKEIDE